MIRTYVIGGVRVCREALEQTVASPGVVEVIGGSRHPLEASNDRRILEADVVVLIDPDLDDRRWLATLQAMQPTIEFVLVGLEQPERDLAGWLEVGIVYVGCEATLEEMVAALRQAAARQRALRPHLPSGLGLYRSSGGAPSVQPGLAVLTRREWEILGLVAEGCSNLDIAGRLYVALATVKNHVHNILEKLEVHARLEAVEKARRIGYTLAPVGARA
jgi:DNA-binding NarL/FixJ family response regulator